MAIVAWRDWNKQNGILIHWQSGFWCHAVAYDPQGAVFNPAIDESTSHFFGNNWCSDIQAFGIKAENCPVRYVRNYDILLREIPFVNSLL